jgi:deoxyribodipyrimidine photolyase-like uncharacterized protein
MLRDECEICHYVHKQTLNRAGCIFHYHIFWKFSNILKIKEFIIDI